MTPDQQAVMDRYRAAVAHLMSTGPYTVPDAVVCIQATYELRRHVMPHLPADERQEILDELERVRAAIQVRRDARRDQPR